tara:strand:+ start:311 stop:529 length:219 start_codon:yes stop_codon:yes gene_type:complete
MEKTKLTPVEVCIRAFGGVRPMARIINRNCGSISKWRKSGLIPTSIQRTVLEKAWELNLPEITPYSIIFGEE